MKPRQCVGDGQAKSRALVALAEGGIDLAEGPHGGLDFGRRHAASGIGHLDDRIAGLQRTHVDLDAAAFRRELHGIANQVDQDRLMRSGSPMMRGMSGETDVSRVIDFSGPLHR